MRVKLITAILLIICSVWIGSFAFENLMWAVWGKQNRWFEYVGFWGCPIMFCAGVLAFASLRLGSLLGCAGFGLMMFYLGPALVNTIHRMMFGQLVLEAAGVIKFVFIIGIPLITVMRLIWNVKEVSSSRS